MHFAPWYRREDYALIREIMEDGEDTLPLTFDEWERNAEYERAAAKREGTIVIPVFIDPDEFFSFCMRWKIPLNKTTRGICQQPRGGKFLHGDVSLTMGPLVRCGPCKLRAPPSVRVMAFAEDRFANGIANEPPGTGRVVGSNPILSDKSVSRSGPYE